MGFLFSERVATTPERDLQLWHRLECKVCPLDKIKNHHPHMKPTGAERPLIYVLGEAPGKDEDEENEQFVGKSGQLLRPRIPRALRSQVRYNNVVRTRPPKNRTPERPEIECCRPSVTKDIEASKPAVILGFGNVPLQWISDFNGITVWRGRKMPVRVGSHTCWFYPMLHPAYLLRQRPGSEEERMFAFDLKRAFAEIKRGLPEAHVHSPAEARAGVEITDNLDRIEEFLFEAAGQPAVGLDYETIGLRPYAEKAKILTAGVSYGYKTLAFAFDHPGAAGWTKAERKRLGEIWRNFLLTAKAVKVVHNLAFEMEWTGFFFGEDLLRAGRWEDTATQAAIIDERRGNQKPGPFSLEFLVQQYFGFNLKKLSSIDRRSLSAQPLKAVLEYNGLDAKYHLLLWEKQLVEIKRQELVPAYELGLRRVPTVVLSQMKGVPVDQAQVRKLQVKYTARIEKLEVEIASLDVVKKFRRRMGHNFNPNSNPDVGYVFDKMLECPEVHVVDKYSQKERISADVSVLTQITHPLASALVELRQSNKRKATYIDPLVEGSPILYPDGMLHAQFNTIFAETGRLSCDGPNLQNFPKRLDEAKEVRRSIRAPKGCVVMAFDYGQIEARVIAMFTKDKVFCKALWEQYDVHLEWAERIAYAYPARVGGKSNLKDKKIMGDFRTDIKNQWTFPLFFGAKLESAAGYLSIPVDVLESLYDEFWEQFEGVKVWQDELIQFYEDHGYVACLTGRRRRGPLSVNKVINSPVQGTAAEIVMDAMCRLSETGDPELQPEINIHDDFTYVRVPANRSEEIAERIIGMMLAVPFDFVNVPITVEASFGPNWTDLAKLGMFSSDTWGG